MAARKSSSRYLDMTKDALMISMKRLEGNGNRVGLFVVGKVKNKLNVGAKQETYKVRRQSLTTSAAVVVKKKRYTKATPGDPPRKRTGTLQKSIDHRVERYKKTARKYGGIRVFVGTNIEYARRLELGWPAIEGSALGKNAHPYFRPVLADRDNRRKIIEKFAKGLF